MIALKCKLCGGNIQITGESHGICDSCGSEVTLPKIDDDKRAEFYNRGNHFRQKGDFDRAYSAFEHIIADNMQDAEAHWSLTLCRYGVEYVQDPRSGEYKPTVSRMSFSPVLEDPDYLKALEYSDEYTKDLYRRAAGKIALIQERFLEISKKEEPYDVFICFKAEEDNGNRTLGSIIAQDIYEKLSEKGIRTFFSRITLENKIGEEYEPYIFAALNSAKIMLVVSNKPEHLEARWVKNEWSRFLNMMDKDHNKSMIRVFQDMSPYDFPMELQSTAQGVDASRVGYMQDLIRGISKILGINQESNLLSTQNMQKMTIGNLLKRTQQALEDGTYHKALEFTDQILNMDPESGEGFFYQLLAVYNVPNINKLKAIENISVIENVNFKRACQYAAPQRKEELHEVWEFYTVFGKSRDALEAANKGDYKKAREKIEELKSASSDFQLEDSKSAITDLVKQVDFIEVTQKYQKALQLKNKKDYEGAMVLFQDLGDYKDSKKLYDQCRDLDLHDKQLKEYRKVVGDGKSYLKDRFMKERCWDFKEYESLKTHYKGSYTPFQGILVFLVGILLSYPGWKHMIQLQTAAKTYGMSKWLVDITELRAKHAFDAGLIRMLWPILWILLVCFLFQVVLIVCGCEFSFGGFLISAILLFALVWWTPVALPVIIFPLLVGVPVLIITGALMVDSMQHYQLERKVKAFEEEQIKPFEEAERKAIAEKYTRLKPGELVELISILDMPEEETPQEADKC